MDDLFLFGDLVLIEVHLLLKVLSLILHLVDPIIPFPLKFVLPSS